jgi:hypothetical protein
MPSLLRAYELSTRAAQVGFDWVKTDDVIDKAEEEIRELREAVAEGGGKSAEAEEEFGDLCSRWSTSRASWASNQKRRSAWRTTSFNAASTTSSARLLRVARGSGT